MALGARPTTHIEFMELPDGVHRATCPELSLSAEGCTLAEAEAALNRLIEERTAQIGAVLSPSAVDAERDTRIGPEDEDRPTA